MELDELLNADTVKIHSSDTVEMITMTDTMINRKTDDMTKLMMVDPMTDGHLIDFPMNTKTFKL